MKYSTSHCDVLEIYLVAYCNEEGRSCSPLLVALAKRGFGVVISHLLLRFEGYALCSSRLSAEARERDFALLLKLTFGQLRPKGYALWTSASWAQLDQLMSAALPPGRADS